MPQKAPLFYTPPLALSIIISRKDFNPTLQMCHTCQLMGNSAAAGSLEDLSAIELRGHCGALATIGIDEEKI